MYVNEYIVHRVIHEIKTKYTTNGQTVKKINTKLMCIHIY